MEMQDNTLNLNSETCPTFTLWHDIQFHYRESPQLGVVTSSMLII